MCAVLHEWNRTELMCQVSVSPVAGKEQDVDRLRLEPRSLWRADFSGRWIEPVTDVSNTHQQ